MCVEGKKGRSRKSKLWIGWETDLYIFVSLCHGRRRDFNREHGTRSVRGSLLEGESTYGKHLLECREYLECKHRQPSTTFPMLNQNMTKSSRCLPSYCLCEEEERKGEERKEGAGGVVRRGRRDRSTCALRSIKTTTHIDWQDQWTFPIFPRASSHG